MGTEGNAGVRASTAALICILGLALAVLLNAETLQESASSGTIGPEREIRVAAWGEAADISRAIGTDRIRSEAESALGRDRSLSAERPGANEPARFQLGSTTALHGPSTAAPGSSATALPGPSATGGDPGRAPVGDDRVPAGAVTSPADSVDPYQRRRSTIEISERNPLRVLVMGDSMIEAVGLSVRRMAAEMDMVDVEVDFRVATGFTRPEYFDWNRHLDERLADRPPDATLVMFGANDAQSMDVDGRVVERFSDEWLAVYRDRVSRAMDSLESQVAFSWWAGLPPMRDGAFNDKMLQLNEIFRSEAEGRIGIFYLPTDAMFGPPGLYSPYLTSPDGSSTSARSGDGIHFEIGGADRLNSAAFAEMSTLLDIHLGQPER